MEQATSARRFGLILIVTAFTGLHMNLPDVLEPALAAVAPTRLVSTFATILSLHRLAKKRVDAGACRDVHRRCPLCSPSYRQGLLAERPSVFGGPSEIKETKC